MTDKIKIGDTPKNRFGIVEIKAQYDNHIQVELFKRSIRGLLPEDYGIGQNGPQSYINFMVYEKDILLLLRLLRNGGFTHTSVELSPLYDERWDNLKI